MSTFSFLNGKRTEPREKNLILFKKVSTDRNPIACPSDLQLATDTFTTGAILFNSRDLRKTHIPLSVIFIFLFICILVFYIIYNFSNVMIHFK